MTSPYATTFVDYQAPAVSATWLNTVNADIPAAQASITSLNSSVSGINSSISTINSTLTTKLTSSTLADTSSISNGDALVGVKLNATGAVARTQHDKNADMVSVKDFGAVGDGVTDDTSAIQAALNTGKRVFGLSGDTYLISTTLNMSVAGVEFDGCGCSFKVKSGTLTGTMLQGRFFIIAADKCVLRNFSIPYNASASFSASVDGNGMPVTRWAITIGASAGSTVENIAVTNSRSGATSTWNGGIACSGGNSSNTLIQNNRLIQTASGIVYSPDSFSGKYNKAVGNYIEDAFYCMSGSDPTVSNTSIGNLVERNTLVWTTFSAYQGIEDYSATNYNLIGTRISKNVILGSATSTPLFYAISAVSRNTIIEENVILDWYPSLTTGTAAIELFGESGSTVANNVIRWTNSPEGCVGTTRMGITSSNNLGFGSNKVISNLFENANYGLWLHAGANAANWIIQSNDFKGCARPIYNDGTKTNLTISGNRLTAVRPATGARDFISLFGGQAQVLGNTFEFETASNQDTFTITIIRVGVDNVTICNNFGNMNNLSFLSEVIAIWTAGSTPTNAVVANNTFIGGMHCYLDGFTKVQSFGNVVPAGMHGVANNKLAFYDGQSPIVQPTGYGTPTNVSKTASLPGTTATLAQVGGTLAALIADLKSQNLIGA